jgi:hypothetical protein
MGPVPVLAPIVREDREREDARSSGRAMLRCSPDADPIVDVDADVDDAAAGGCPAVLADGAVPPAGVRAECAGCGGSPPGGLGGGESGGEGSARGRHVWCGYADMAGMTGCEKEERNVFGDRASIDTDNKAGSGSTTTMAARSASRQREPFWVCTRDVVPIELEYR